MSTTRKRMHPLRLLLALISVLLFIAGVASPAQAATAGAGRGGVVELGDLGTEMVGLGKLLAEDVALRAEASAQMNSQNISAIGAAPSYFDPPPLSQYGNAYWPRRWSTDNVGICFHGVGGGPWDCNKGGAASINEAVASSGRGSIVLNYNMSGLCSFRWVTTYCQSVRAREAMVATRRAYPGRHLFVVGYSLGGLVIEQALAGLPKGYVRAVVTIATPFTGVPPENMPSGSQLTAVGRALVPGSLQLRRLPLGMPAGTYHMSLGGNVTTVVRWFVFPRTIKGYVNERGDTLVPLASALRWGTHAKFTIACTRTQYWPFPPGDASCDHDHILRDRQVRLKVQWFLARYLPAISVGSLTYI